MKQKLLITLILANLSLTGCGGGGSNSTSPSSSGNPPNNSGSGSSGTSQLWMPYTQQNSSGQVTQLWINSINNPSQSSQIPNVTTTPSLMSQSDFGIISNGSTSPAFITAAGVHYQFYANNNQIYALDLSSSAAPVAVQLGNLPTMTVCSISAEQINVAGDQGYVLVSGTNPSSPSCQSNLTSLSWYAVPFNAAPNQSIQPLGFSANPTTTFNDPATFTPAGYLLDQGNHASIITSFASNATPNTVSLPAYIAGSSFLSSENGGNGTNRFVWVDTPNNTNSINTLYNIAYTGSGVPTATLVTGLPSSPAAPSNTTADASGNLYLAYIIGTSGAYSLSIYKIPVSGATATLAWSLSAVGDSNTTAVSVANLFVNATGTGFGVQVAQTETSATTPIYNLYVHPSNGSPLGPIPTPNQGGSFGADGSLIIAEQSSIQAINLSTGASNSIGSASQTIDTLSSSRSCTSGGYCVMPSFYLTSSFASTTVSGIPLQYLPAGATITLENTQSYPYTPLSTFTIPTTGGYFSTTFTGYNNNYLQGKLFSPNNAAGTYNSQMMTLQSGNSNLNLLISPAVTNPSFWSF